MAVIKCANCENEILDTEIVCPYCDYPVSAPEEDKKEEALSGMNGETIRISLSSKPEEKNDALEEISEATPEEKPEEIHPDTAEEKPEEAYDDASEEVQDNNTEEITDDMRESEDISVKTYEEADDVKAEETDETKKESDSSTMKISKDDIRSDALRRSLEERKAKREQTENTKKKKDHKLVILTVTIIGIFVIIYLLINVFQSIVGEGLFEDEKESKKSKVEVDSSAELIDLGFEIHSHTLTIVEEAIVSTDYQAGDEKPWKDHKKDITNLTIADGIETIGAHAFDDLKGLRHVTLAPSVKTIGDSAFYACSKLEKLAFDSEKISLESIGNYAFTDCDSLESVTFGSGLKQIGEGVFKSCDNLEKVVIPDSVEEIGADAFLGCHKLVIECSRESYAYEYATQNGIKVEIEGEEGAHQEPSAPVVEPKPTTPVKPPQPSTPPAEPPADTPAPEPTNEEKIAALMAQFASAQTQEEKDNILAQIDALTN